jgi:hypothetical protein
METLALALVVIVVIWLTGWFRPAKQLSDTFVNKTTKVCTIIDLEDEVKFTKNMNKIASKVNALTEVNDEASVRALLKAKLNSATE